MIQNWTMAGAILKLSSSRSQFRILVERHQRQNQVSALVLLAAPVDGLETMYWLSGQESTAMGHQMCLAVHQPREGVSHLNAKQAFEFGLGP